MRSPCSATSILRGSHLSTRRCRGPRSSSCRRRTAPFGISPWKSTYSSGWSSVRTARRLSFGAWRQPLGYRPRGEHAVALEPQVPVQARRRVLVDHEARRLRRPRRRLAPRFAAVRCPALARACCREVAFGAVLLQPRGSAGSTAACCSCAGWAPTASRWCVVLRGFLRRRFFAPGAVGGFLRGSLLRRGRACAPSRGALAGALAHRLEARLQRAHQVGRRRLLLLGFRLHRDLLALGLALDQREHLVAVGVVVLLRLEVAGQRSDQLLGDRRPRAWSSSPRSGRAARRGGRARGLRRRTASSPSRARRPSRGSRRAAPWSGSRRARSPTFPVSPIASSSSR